MSLTPPTVPAFTVLHTVQYINEMSLLAASKSAWNTHAHTHTCTHTHALTWEKILMSISETTHRPPLVFMTSPSPTVHRFTASNSASANGVAYLEMTLYPSVKQSLGGCVFCSSFMVGYGRSPFSVHYLLCHHGGAATQCACSQSGPICPARKVDHVFVYSANGISPNWPL